MNNEAIISEISKELNITVAEAGNSFSKQMLVDKINELVATDMHKLIFILYRMDINETKMRAILKNNPGSDAGLLIADLMIERQAEKIKSRQQFSQRDNNIDEEEKW